MRWSSHSTRAWVSCSEGDGAPVGVAFGGDLTAPADLAAEKLVWEPERSIGALDDTRWVGGTGAFTFDLTLPGGTTIPSPGVTMVGVLPTHRRRGILTELMSRQLDDFVEQGEAVAMLTASESAIYGRYGYGIATTAARIHLGVDRARFAVPVEVPTIMSNCLLAARDFVFRNS